MSIRIFRPLSSSMSVMSPLPTGKNAIFATMPLALLLGRMALQPTALGLTRWSCTYAAGKFAGGKSLIRVDAEVKIVHVAPASLPAD